MDRAITKKKWTAKRIAWMAGIPLCLAAILTMAFSNSTSTYKTDKARVTVSEVVHQDFQDVISIQGAVEPLTTIQIDASEGGVVEEIFVEDGQAVAKGQPLMRLSNASLMLEFMNRETQIVEQINNLRSTRISLDQNKRAVQEQLLDVQYQLKEQRRQWAMDSSLFEDSVIAESDYLATKANYTYLQKRQALLNERLATDEAYRTSQMHRIDGSVDMMERNLEAIRKNLENLVVKAPIDGQINSFDHEIGQTKQRGENLGRVDVPGRFQVSAMVDQYYINRLKEGQLAKVESGGHTFTLEVSKIYPTVVNNQFEVEMQFIDTIPQRLRRGQNLQLRVELSALRKSLLVKRGAFYQSSGGKYAYVMVNEDEALKRPIELGIQNPDHIEVLSGLEEGEQIITSSYEAFGDAERIKLTD